MKNNRLFLDRKFFEDKQQRGYLYVVNESILKQQFKCCTLELPYIENERMISSIPRNKVYNCKKRYSEKYGHHIHVTDVPNRDMILIHSGNHYTHTKGCILVGEHFADINNDGINDVTNSRVTLDKLLEYLDDEFKIMIL